MKYMNKSKIKCIFSLVITIVGLLSLFVGTSYALLKGTSSSNNEQIIKAGSVELKLTENFENIDKKITIMSDADGLMQDTTYDFNLKNIGSEPAKFDIKLVNEVPSSYTGEVLDIDYFRIGLEINGEEHGPMNLDEVKGIIDSDIIYEKELINYKMRIWLDEEKSNELKEMEDFKAFLKLEVEAEQRVEEMDPIEKTTTFSYTGDVQEYKVPRNGYYYIEMAGAQGGTVPTGYTGGLGAKTSGYVYLNANEKLYFYVGGQGSTGTSAVIATYQGGYNGGGNGYVNRAGYTQSNASGGGATDVRLKKADKTEKYRYVRNYINGSSANANSHWVEIQVYNTAGTLISNGKTVTYNGTGPHYGGNVTTASGITDGNTATANYFGLAASSDAYVEIDLGAEYEIGRVVMYHYYGDSRTYYNNKLMLFDETKNESATIFNSDAEGTYAESSSGKTAYNLQYRESLISRIMVAGGGGGAYSEYVSTSDAAYIYGGDGGALQGETAIYRLYYGYSSLNPTGGNQKSGGQGLNSWTATSYVNAYIGTFGAGGTGDNSYSGGGGGYYGGASGVWQPGAGGSSYISGYAGVNSVEDDISIKHTNQTLHYSGKYFVGGQMISGQNEGNGYAKIIYIGEKPEKKSTKLDNVRYVKNCSSYNSSNNGNHWIEIQAIKDGINVAKSKKVTGTIAENTSYPYSRVTDGDITFSVYSASASNSTNQCITVDLEKEYDLDEVAVWNYFGDQRTYYDNITYVSKDNSTWTSVINEAHIETSNGQRLNVYTDTYNGYVQDNLVLWYDGYANNGGTRAHVNSTWKDLSGTGYNGTISGGVWYNNYLNSTGAVTSNVATSTLLPAASDRTLSITLKINSVPYTNTTYGDTGVFIGGAYYGGMGIYWTRPTSAARTDIAGFTRTSTAEVWPAYATFTYPTPIMNLTYVNNHSNGSVKTYLNGKLIDARISITGSYSNTSTVGNVGINKAQIAGGNYTTNYGNLNVYAAQIYTKALTDEEVKHNYLYEKQKFKLE